MASPGEMVKVIASVLGVPEAQVVQHDRNLAVAGLRTVGGRGKSAAKMTPADAANLLIGVGASSMVKETVEVVNDYSNLPSQYAELKGVPDNQTSSIPGLRALPKRHGFRDALTALITSAVDGSLHDTLNEKASDRRLPMLYSIKVIFWGPFPQAAIRISYDGHSERHHYSSIPNDLDQILMWAKDQPPDHGDLHQIREFSEKTIFALGDLLKS